MQLRYLQTLTEIGAEQNSTIIFPMPIDIIKPFLDLREKACKPAGANGDGPRFAGDGCPFERVGGLAGDIAAPNQESAMITIEVIAPSVLKIIAPEKLCADDFADLAPQVEVHHKTTGPRSGC